MLSRGRTHLVGTITKINAEVGIKGDSISLAYVLILGKSVDVKVRKNQKYQIGDRLLLEVIEWGEKNKNTLCKPHRVLGHISDPSVDIKAAVEEHDLRDAFPKNVTEEAKAFDNKVKKQELKDRLDLTKTLTFTIDPETAKDFDDALSIAKDEKGHFSLMVHIADVSHYIRKDSALDQEAILRGNSTYFPGSCIPMLPEQLSNNLCSLRQGVIRLTVSVLMEFDKEAKLIHSEVKRSYIKSKKCLTYEKARKIIENRENSPYRTPLLKMMELCNLLKKRRALRGSIDFALPELVIKVDEKGNPTKTKIEEYDITHQIVEEFMLKANEVVAQFLSNQGKELLFRIHEEPASENMEDFFSIARSLGFNLPSKPTPEDLQDLFDQAAKTPFSQQLAIGFIRNLKLAYYSPRNVGHFGLALEHYCHFTSPIRRYSDLIIHRLLFEEEEQLSDLEKIGQRLSDMERRSFRSETSVKLLKKLRLLKRWMKEDPDREYEAVITRIKPFGLFFEVKELFLEGFLHISELENDFFVFDSTRPMLHGRSTGTRYMIGNLINVRPISVDLIYVESKWELALDENS